MVDAGLDAGLPLIALGDYTGCDATELAARVRRGDVQPAELVRCALEALDKVEPALNAVVDRWDDAARRAASAPLPDGPFAGVPFVVKDLDGFVAGVPYTASARFLRGFVPDHDSEVVARLRRTGLIFLAKTSCPELGLVNTTEPELHGPTRNPWSTDHSTGGSSGGTAACVAAGVVPMGHGGDGGGSIRIPASACGLFGLKPTRARVSLGPDSGEGWGGYVQPGVITRSVRDSAAALDAIAGPSPGDPYAAPPLEIPCLEAIRRPPGRLRVAFDTGSLFGDAVHPACAAAVRDAAALCEDLGHEVVEARPPFDRDALVWAYLVQVATGTSAAIAEAEGWVGREATPAEFEAATWFLHQVGRALTAGDLQRSRDVAHRAGRVLAPFFETHDVFLDATLAYPPTRIGELAPRPHERLGLAVLRRVPVRRVLKQVLRTMAAQLMERAPNTMLFNQTGQPAMSVPLGHDAAGLPLGVQFVARAGGESLLFQLAAQLEEARPWAQRRPRVHAAS